jgi:hypothetical protein
MGGDEDESGGQHPDAKVAAASQVVETLESGQVREPELPEELRHLPEKSRKSRPSATAIVKK